MTGINIAFLTTVPITDIKQHGIYSDLMRMLVEKGNSVSIFFPIEKRNAGTPRLSSSKDGRVEYIGIKTGNLTKCGLIEKGVSMLTLESVFWRAINKVPRRFDLILYSTPPITFYKAVFRLKKRDNAVTYLMLKDIFPQNSVDLGMLSKHGIRGFIYRYFRNKEKKLYSLIWKRCIASQMADAKIEKTNITIEGSNFAQHFISQGEQVVFDGFLKLYIEGKDDDTGDEMMNEGETGQLLPRLSADEQLGMIEISAVERFTQRPPRYSEASLVKKLEELGIGRPSTYAPTITTITQRGYIVKEDREGVSRSYRKFTLKDNTIEKSICTENSGSEKGKLFPQDINISIQFQAASIPARALHAIVFYSSMPKFPCITASILI